ncbi:hypothetical protein V3M57_09860 [Trueperella pyogenes]
MTFDQVAKGRVVRLVEDRILAEGLSIQDACQAVAPKLGVSWHTARQWLGQACKPGQVTRAEEELVTENARLRRENQELRDTNELLKTTSAFSRQNSAPMSELIAFIDKCRDRFSVEFICATLNRWR